MVAIGRPRTCDCGICPKCKHREYMYRYYRQNGKTYLNVEKRRERDRWRWHNDAAYRRKKVARSLAHNRLKRGTLSHEPCLLCGEPETNFHHNDYDQPYEVIHLCTKCHNAIHGVLPQF